MRKLILILCLLLPVGVQALDLEDIRLRMRALWGEYDNTNSYWPDSVLNNVINDAQALIAHLGKAVEQDTTIVLTANNHIYSLPSDFDGAISLYRFTRLEQLTAQYMDWAQWSRSAQGSGPAQQYTIWNARLYIFPAVEGTGSKDSVRLNYYATVDTMPGDTSTCRLPTVWHPLVAFVAREILKAKELQVDVFPLVQAKIEAYRREHLIRQPDKAVMEQ